MRQVFKRKYIAVINGIGGMIELLALVLLGIVITANR